MNSFTLYDNDKPHVTVFTTIKNKEIFLNNADYINEVVKLNCPKS